jgi:hypothetical protein
MNSNTVSEKNRAPQSVSPVSTAPNAVKSTLARLLATENIVVLHSNTSTAYFDLKNRELHLPMWSNTTGALYDMLVGHEVSHALNTPCDGWKTSIDAISAELNVKQETAKQYLNIVEDARIERLIKDKFRGLNRDFVDGYKTLVSRKFFGDLSDTSKMIFADRFNLYFKCGIHTGLIVNFNTQESAFIARGARITTWEDTVALARDMIVYAQQQNTHLDQPQTGSDNSKSIDDCDDSDQNDSSDSETSQSNKTNHSDKSDPSEKNNQNDDGENNSSDENDAKSRVQQKTNNTQTKNIDPVTNRTLEKQLESLIESESGAPSAVFRVSAPETDLKSIVIPFTKIIEVLSTTGFAPRLQERVHIADYTAAAQTMATAFNRKQAADIFRRSTIAQTGALDPLKMNQYRWTDDIFRKTTRIAQGKNHGVVMLLDWSGSMCRIMRSTIGQLFIVTDFCRKVGIPFEVYAFTNTQFNKSESVKPSPSFYVEDMHLLNFLSSCMNSKEYESMKSALWNWDEMSMWDQRFRLNATPTISAMLHASVAVAQFQAATRVQITHTVVLTDGEPTDGYCFSLQRWYNNRLSEKNKDAVSSAESEEKGYQEFIKYCNQLGNRYSVVMTDPWTGMSYDVKKVYRGAIKKEGSFYNYGTFTPAKFVDTHSYPRTNEFMQIALDILRRRTGSKIHWIGLSTAKRLSASEYYMEQSKTHNWKRDGFLRGVVHGWDSAIIVDAERFQRTKNGEVQAPWGSKAASSRLNSTSRLDMAKSKREILNAFVENQQLLGSLRNVATFVGEHLATV